MRLKTKLVLELCSGSAALYFLSLSVAQQNFTALIGLGTSLIPLINQLQLTEKNQIDKLIQVFNYLSLCSASAGIVVNATDEVIWRNPFSEALMTQWKRQNKNFCPPTNTGVLHDSLNLKQLKADILDLNSVVNWDCDFLYKNYRLAFPGIGFVQVHDKFYRLDLNNQTYRIWINLSFSFNLE